MPGGLQLHKRKRNRHRDKIAGVVSVLVLQQTHDDRAQESNLPQQVGKAVVVVPAGQEAHSDEACEQVNVATVLLLTTTAT